MPVRDCIFAFRPLFVVAAATLTAGVTACSPTVTPADPALAALVQRIGQSEIARMPEEADTLGLSQEAFGRPYDSLLDDRSIAVAERMNTVRLDLLRELEKIDRSALTRDSIRTLDTELFHFRAATSLERYGYGYVNLGWASPYLINQSDGAYADLIKFMTVTASIRSRADANAWLARLRQVDDAIRDERRRFETDIEDGATPPRVILERTLAKSRSLTPHNAREHPLVVYFVESLAQIPDVPEADIKQMSDEAAKLVGGDIAAEYHALNNTLEKALTGASDQPGVWRLRNGEAYYRDALRLYTTTDLAPAELHSAGLKLVGDLTKQMDALLLELGQEDGTVGQRMRNLSVAPAYLLPDTPEGRAALIETLESHVKWIETRLPRITSLVPKGKVEVRQAPAIAQDTAPGAYYRAAALDGSRTAAYTINLRSTLDFPIWTLPTLSFHEAAPGHHIQAGLARENTAQPIVNYITFNPAFAEGWAVYAEDLANEVGAYETDKLAKLGYLQSLLFRAARLVVDTGIHSQRWSREQAINYLVETTGLPRAAMENEVNRYTIWPGQACAYMAGRETIRRLRKTADDELGPNFDLRAFHDAVLANGARPLPVLEADIADWIASRRPALPTE